MIYLLNYSIYNSIDIFSAITNLFGSILALHIILLMCSLPPIRTIYFRGNTNSGPDTIIKN